MPTKPMPPLERLHTSVEGVQGLDLGPDDIWLNTPETVEAIVRNFANETLRRFADLGQSDPSWTPEKFDLWAKAECARLGALFLGYGETPDTDYVRGVWNTPHQLGVYISVCRRYQGEARYAVRDAFYSFANDLVITTAAHADEPIEAWGWELDALIEDLSLQLVGLWEPDDDGSEDSVSPTLA